MWIVVTALLLATPILGHYLDGIPEQQRQGVVSQGNREPEHVVIQRTYNVSRPTWYMTCPPRAVCGVQFDFRRLRRGRRLPERRRIFHCRCPDSETCPMEPEHRVYSSIKRREYLCQPRDSLPTCTQRTPVAKELVEGDENYDFYSYFRINCLCPGHLRPRIPKRRRGMALATRIYRVRFDWGRHMSFHLRHCVLD